MKVLIYTANLDSFYKTQENEEQELPEGIGQIEYWRCTDSDFPPRFNAMTPRLQARLVKMFGWQFKPDFDIYLWVDSSCRLSKPDSLKWFMEQLGQANIAAFKHPHRNTVQEEADYLKHRLNINCPYITPRYENEDIDGQLEQIDPTAPLYASTAFIYRSSPLTQLAMKEWFYHTSRFHSIAQLSLPYVIKDLKVNVIPDNYMKCKYLEFTRGHGHK